MPDNAEGNIAVIRIKGMKDVASKSEDTLKILGLKRKYSFVVLPRTTAILGMLRKVDNLVTWGEVSKEMEEKLSKKKGLHPPVKGLRSVKQRYPKGDLGYRGKEIEKLIERMAPKK